MGEAIRDRTGKLQKEQEAFRDALVRDFNAKAEEDEEESTEAGSLRDLKLDDALDGISYFGEEKSEYSAGSSSSSSSSSCGKRSRGEERYNADGRQDWDSSTS